ncbi:YncE family protein [Geomicrobium sp. JCM 19039]|uniref:YncE family protein n=1 Tax=Geomicrobium sp. JCM 19039 TaxID=1460636 RepID=UPI00045F4BEA|nr:YncE family protein [Geomicrobium sp. JCM 19039]GAK14092.1 hypothetical protein JCM19039_3988 [Geomicrobium sp. JCM 19039]
MKDGRRWIVLYNNVINGPPRPTSPLLPTTPTVPTGLNKVYTLMPTTGNASVFAGHTETRVGTLPATFLSRAIAVDPVRNVVYVAPGEAPNMVSVYCAETEKVIKHITVKSLFPSPEAIALNLKTNRVYIGTLTGQLFVINGHTFTQEKLIGTGQLPCRLTALAVNAKSNVVYVVSGGQLSNELNIVNGTTNEVIGPFTEGLANPSDVLVDERTNFVYVSNHDGGTVSIYDGETMEFLDEILVGGSPKQMELDLWVMKCM